MTFDGKQKLGDILDIFYMSSPYYWEIEQIYISCNIIDEHICNDGLILQTYSTYL